MTAGRPRGEEGAYAILYALLVVALVSMCAIVVDLASLRENRRETRLATDAAALGAAAALETATPNPRQACENAWSYVATNLRITVPATTGCTGFPTTVPSPCPAFWPVAVGASGAYTVTVAWPVVNTSALLTSPDAAPAGSTTSQPVDPRTDGTEPCQRVAVSIAQRQSTAFAGLFGIDQSTTEVTSVARATLTSGTTGRLAALNVLEPTGCNVIDTGGQGSIEVGAVGSQPGVIAIESSGRENGIDCPRSSPWVVNAALNSSGSHVRADGPSGPGTGRIDVYALNPAPTGNPTQAYDPQVAPPRNTILMPAPTPLGLRSGATPVTNIYDCSAARSCPRTRTQYLTNLTSVFGASATGMPSPYAAAGAFPTTPFQLWTSHPGFAALRDPCKVTNSDLVRVPAGNWYVDCPDLSVAGTLVFAGGNVVTRGSISVSNFGCFAMNVPQLTATCPTVVAGVVTPQAAAEGILYLRTGGFSKGAQSSIVVERTFTYLKNGAFSFGGGAGALYLRQPLPSGMCSGTCAEARFDKIAVWSESSADQSLGGQTNLSVTGIVFTPNSLFQYSGAGLVVQTKAQFWARKIRLSGQGLLRMAPDASGGVDSPVSGVLLIR
ncbi:MAG TPA: hypothetical protein VGX28_00175 [Frankiaceae bacterium]|jgi:Flp pilus assembly protein TadG|nr:hypothetical protein [Frankiaceae bacterium]